MVGEAWAENPRLVIAEPWQAFVRLWAACRSGMGGIAHWPDAGGVNDQAAWVVDGFALLAGAEFLEKKERRRTHYKSVDYQ
ncbi:MAG: hypothetical protein INF88_12300 [Roseomonas sp.]|nr:hypothetical protein [Roseomonas sp.]